MMQQRDIDIRPYKPADEAGVRAIYGDDEFARPALMARYPRMRDYLADTMRHYWQQEPESTWVALSQGMVVGALLGAVNSRRTDGWEETNRRQVLVRCLLGCYGWPGWLPAVLRTDRANARLAFPVVDLAQYPAHLHIGLQPEWRRRGIGSALMARFAAYLRERGVPGYHLTCASFHPLGMAFYRKLGLTELGAFQWRIHTGIRWKPVTEVIFGCKLEPVCPPTDQDL